MPNSPFYVGIVIDESGSKGFFDVVELLRIVKYVNDGINVFYVKPKTVKIEESNFDELEKFLESSELGEYNEVRSKSQLRRILSDGYNVKLRQDLGPIIGQKVFDILYNIKIPPDTDVKTDVLKKIDELKSEGSFPVSPKEEELYITHTVSYRNVYGDPDYVSTNHCQEGSSILVYELFIPE
jgi:hypothetical protein